MVVVCDSEALVSLADVAEMAGVSRPAVSNWRRRNPDFPAPVRETGATSLFRLAELQAWMSQHGKPLKTLSVDQLVWSALNRIRGEVRPEEAALAGMTVLGYLALTSRLGGDEQQTLRTAIRSDLGALTWLLDYLTEEARRVGLGETFAPQDQLPAWWDECRPFLSDAVELAALFGTAEVFEALIAATARGSRGASEHTTPSSVADLLVTLAAPAGGVVLDPACGFGTLLLEASRRSGVSLTLIGQDINRETSRIARLRMFVHGVAADVLQGDTLLDGIEGSTAAADLVLADPPFGADWDPESANASERMAFGVPPPSKADMAWLQDGIASLRPGGLAMYVLPAGTLFRGGAEGEIRRRLIHSRAIHAVIALPPSLYPMTTIPVVLWIVGRPGERDADEVLLLDASQVGERNGKRTELRDADIAAIESIFRAWQTNREVVAVGDVPAAIASDEALLRGNGVLTPARWIRPTAEDPERRLERISNGQQELRAAGAAFAQSVPSIPHLEPAAGAASLSRLTFRLGDVARVVRPRRIATSAIGLGTTPLIRPKDITPGVPVVPSSHVDLRLVPGPVEMTRAGDVIVLAEGPKPRAAVDHLGGAVVSGPLEVVRPLHDSLDPTVLAALITLLAPRYAVGTTVEHVDLPAIELPYPDPRVAQWLRHALDALGEQHRLALAAAQSIEALRADLVEGLCSGTLTIADGLPIQ